MRVKRLHLLGFKSFANKTAIHFEPGVTAIVGPNGSGKCVHGSTRVVLSDGRVVPIQELVETALGRTKRVEQWDDGSCSYENPQSLSVFSLNPSSLKVEARPITAFVKRRAPDQLYRIVTKTGREVIATGYHPLFTLHEGRLQTVETDQLKVGVRIAMPRYLPIASHEDEMDIQAILRRFERADAVYIPYSSSLEGWVDEVSRAQGGMAAAARVAGIEDIHLRTIRQRQALNVATVSRLQEYCGSSGVRWRGSVLQSRHPARQMTIPTHMTPVLGRFLGYCISEGRNSSGDQVRFVNSDPALIEDFCRCATEVFGLTARVLTYKPTSKDIIIFSHALCQYLEKAFELGVDQPSREKRVPEAVFKASDDTVTAFLSSLCEGDGYFAIKRTSKTNRIIAYMEYATASRRLAEDVSLLLLRFGIVGRIASKWKAATNTVARTKRQYFSVMVYGVDQLKQLASLLEFKGAKRQALQQLRMLTQAPNPNDDVIPGATALVKDLVRNARVPIKPLRKQYPTLAAYVEQRCDATRPGLGRVLEAAERYGRQTTNESRHLFQQLRRLAASDVYWDEIVRIEEVSGEEWVYDLAVEGHHNFIANGMIVHNSNCVDAIRWVLGEHNPRDVRAPRLEDIIFNGTDTKAPLSMVEVSLLIDNEDNKLPIAFSELEVTRRVYRSGESECFINQNPCRLRDIQELFMGTGLGGGCYAIIAQGHIDLILSSKPEERRLVFEEASGVAKYLSKKAETMRRLDEVEEHLVRLTDIISEVRRQRNALERQAAKARQYKTQWEQLTQGELRLAADEVRTGERLQRETKQRLDALSAQRHAHEAEKQRLLESVQAAQAAVAATQAALQDARTRAVEAASQIEQHTSQLALKTRWMDELAQQRQQLHDELVQLDERTKHLQAQREALATQAASVEADRIAQETQCRQHQQGQAVLEVELAREAEQVAQLKGELFGVASEASRRRNELSDTSLRVQAAQAQQRRLSQQQQAVRVKLEAVAQRQAQVEQERQTLAAQQAELEQHMHTVRQALTQAQGSRHERMGRLTGVRERLLHSQARVKLLEDVWRHYEGFPEAVKALLENPPEGTLGLLADLVEAQPGYEQALEAALGSLASALVVRDREALRRLQQQIRSSDLERMPVVVLSDCPANLPQPEAPEALSHYVRSDAAYPQVVAWLLGAWRVVDGIDRLWEAEGVARGGVVSRDGDRWDGRSWQLVGRRAGESMRIGRKQRFERAQEAVHVLEQELAVAQTAWQQAEEQWQSLTAQEQRVKATQDQLLPGLTKADVHLTQLVHEQKRLHDELKTHELDEGQTQSQVQELSQAQQRLEGEVSDSHAQQQRLDEALKAAHARQEEAAGRRQALAIVVAQLETTIRLLQERIDTSRQRLTDVEAEQQQLAGQLDAKRAQAGGIEARSEELSQQREEHQQRAAALKDEHISLQTEADRVALTLREQEQVRDQVLPQLLVVEQQVLLVAQQVQEQDTRVNELSVRRVHILERLREVYRLDDTALATESSSDQALTEEAKAELTTQVDELKRKLEGVGPISLGSVEEFDELNKRLQLLNTQQDDLIKSRDDLKASITHINRTARVQFRDTFANIREQFQHYYTRLFNGGEADLILLDEDDVLESGIEIVARPPGKRLQNISLLSGGERALTAIALLFALFKVRPSPFCILDEIDAPLDEANIDRFTKVLEEFLSLSQFILVTHNKKTITKADCLYGVTMEQPGISKIVSVKLTTSKRPAPQPATDTPAEPPTPVAVETPAPPAEASASTPAAA